MEKCARVHVTIRAYFVGVHRVGARGQIITPGKMVTVEVLNQAGCAGVEPIDNGTANAHIPLEWAKQIAAQGSGRWEVLRLHSKWVVDIDMP